MREILFRGKRIDNGEWVEGWLYKRYMYPDKMVDAIQVYDGSDFGSVEYHPVVAETIGQYTGLKDKNGKRIFEGDIVNAHFCTNRSKQTFRVIFEEGMFLFDNKCVKVQKYDIYALEVIGNIHDNPELLAEVQDG